jgi:RNA-directed DNA polymerase
LRLADWEQNYAPFQQGKTPKPHSKKPVSTKLRTIDNPTDDLKRVQKRILRRLLDPVKLPDYFYGGVRKRSVGSHATAHLGATTIIKMDIESYYPNTTARHIYKVWNTVLGCSPEIAGLLTKLTTCNFYLPQGAPTSPALANLHLSSFYDPIVNNCVSLGIKTTVWVDDLTFSGARAREIIEPVRQLFAANGYKLSRKKLEILGPRDAKDVTGPRLGLSSLRASEQNMSDLRAGIFNFRSGRFTTRGMAKDLQSLQGKVAYVRSICPGDAEDAAVALADILSRTPGFTLKSH